jgi:hypothetical protein
LLKTVALDMDAEKTPVANRIVQEVLDMLGPQAEDGAGTPAEEDASPARASAQPDAREGGVDVQQVLREVDLSNFVAGVDRLCDRDISQSDLERLLDEISGRFQAAHDDCDRQLLLAALTHAGRCAYGRLARGTERMLEKPRKVLRDYVDNPHVPTVQREDATHVLQEFASYAQEAAKPDTEGHVD